MSPFINRLLAVLGVALVVATGAVVVAHEGASTTATARPAAAAAPNGADTIDIKDFLYGPDAATVAVGTNVTFTNRDSAPHTATSGASPRSDGVFETGTLTKGQSKSITVAKPGTYAYYCAIHPFMKGTLTVT